MCRLSTWWAVIWGRPRVISDEVICFPEVEVSFGTLRGSCDYVASSLKWLCNAQAPMVTMSFRSPRAGLFRSTSARFSLQTAEYRVGEGIMSDLNFKETGMFSGERK